MSGRESPFYIDCRPTTHNAQGLALIGIFATLAISVMMTGRVLGGEVLTWWNNNFYIDGLATLMELAASGLGAIVVVYSIYYFSEKTEAAEAHPYTSMTSYYGQIMVFLGLMNWTCAKVNWANISKLM